MIYYLQKESSKAPGRFAQINWKLFNENTEKNIKAEKTSGAKKLCPVYLFTQLSSSQPEPEGFSKLRVHIFNFYDPVGSYWKIWKLIHSQICFHYLFRNWIN